MNTVTWVAQGVLAIVFLAAGLPKLMRSQLRASMPFVEHFADWQLKGVGALSSWGRLESSFRPP